MIIENRIVVVTGAASGIGLALATRFRMDGAKQVICVDRDEDMKTAAAKLGGVGFVIDVTDEDAVAGLVDTVEREYGPIDLFCSNAGIVFEGGIDTQNSEWQRIWDVNVMSQLYAARHVVPRMISRGGGYLLNTASAAGLLSQIGSAPYAVTKHASVALAEWLAITHGDDGIVVSVLCPQAVRTAMTKGYEESVAAIDGMIEPEAVADACVEAIEAEQFLVLPHPDVLNYFQRKAGNYDRWIRGMRKLNRNYKI